MWPYGRLAFHSPDGCLVNCRITDIYPGRAEEYSRRDLPMVWHVSPALWEVIVNGVVFLPGENSKGGWISSGVQTIMTTVRTILNCVIWTKDKTLKHKDTIRLKFKGCKYIL